MTALLFGNHSLVSLVICSDTEGFSLFDAEMEISILFFCHHLNVFNCCVKGHKCWRHTVPVWDSPFSWLYVLCVCVCACVCLRSCTLTRLIWSKWWMASITAGEKILWGETKKKNLICTLWSRGLCTTVELKIAIQFQLNFNWGSKQDWNRNWNLKKWH